MLSYHIQLVKGRPRVFLRCISESRRGGRPDATAADDRGGGSAAESRGPRAVQDQVHVSPSSSDTATGAGHPTNCCRAEEAAQVVRHTDYPASRRPTSRCRRGRVNGDGSRRRRHSRGRCRRHCRRRGSSSPTSRRRHRSRSADQVLVVVRGQIQNEAGVSVLLFAIAVVNVDAICEADEVTAVTSLPLLGRGRRRLTYECAQRAGGEGRENLGQ